MLGFERGVDARSVEANYNLAADVYNWNTALLGLLDCFLAGGWVFFNVFVSVFDAKLVEIIFGCVAKGAPNGAVDGNGGGFCITHASIISLYFVKRQSRLKGLRDIDHICYNE